MPQSPPDDTPDPAAPTPTDPLAAFGRNLRAVRRRQGMTLVDVAGAAGVTKQYVSQIERHECNPTFDVLHQLAAAVGCTVAEMLQPAMDCPPVVE